MTWYADELLLIATPAALAWVKQSPLAPSAYVIGSLDGYPWYTDEVRHAVPAPGLLIVQPLCGPSSTGHDWYELPPVDWNTTLVPPGPLPPCDPAITQRLCEQQELQSSDRPPADLRSQLAAMAAQLAQAVVFYSCRMWGGGIEHEFALIYAPTETLLTAAPAPADEPAQPRGESALQQALRQLGLVLPTYYFAPHARRFDWEPHRLV